MSANKPSDPSTSAISVRESVKRPSKGGRYAEVVVSENASPKAPSPRIHDKPRRWIGRGTILAGSDDIS